MGGMDAGAPPAITCTVDATRSKGAIRLRGRIVSAVPAFGKYRFEVLKEGGSGNSNVSQSGSFSIPTSEPVFVGEAKLDFSRSTRIRVQFSGDALGAQFACAFDEVSNGK
jgi:hypothetical protein